jgi:hypothetical protein
MQIYGDSLYKALKTIYPEVDWIPWKFSHVPHGFWSNFENQKKFIESIGKNLQINDLDEWYRISGKQIKQFAPTTLLEELGLARILPQVYPSHNWNVNKLSKGPKKASQRTLALIVRDIFHETEGKIFSVLHL